MPVTLRDYPFSDLGPLLDLVRTCYPDTAEPEEWWEWRHRGRVDAPTRFIVAMDGDRVVGMRPVSLFPMRWRNQPLTAAMLTAVMVHPAYRGQGLFRDLVARGLEASWESGATLAFTMPNERSYPLFLRDGWIDPGPRPFFVRPLHAGALLRTRGRAVRWTSGLVDGALRVLRPLPRTDHDITALDRFGAPADTLDRQVMLDNPLLAVERSAALLNWRFVDTQYFRYERWELATDEGWAGYVVLREDRRDGVHIGWLVDLHGRDPRQRQRLIDAALVRAHAQGLHVAAAVMTDPAQGEDLRRCGFFRVPPRFSPRPFRLVWMPAPGMEDHLAPLRHISAWRLTLADFDGI